PVLLRVLAADEDHGGGTVADGGRVPGGDGSAFDEGGPQAGEGLGGGVGPHAFVGVDDGVALASLDGDGRDLLGDEVMRGGGALVRRGGDFVLFLARDGEGGVVPLGGGSHGVVVEGIRESVVGHVVECGDASVRPAFARAGE